ncbi:phospholipase b-like 1 [Anaeramoeba flamelloides]|uniref:Phospholipase B-like n=1 Tax=Anaeramoeba flamelloides TaxID=1746091 RepID=A0ABQ8ZFN7_9EUKA|nr:phospholipase b-like 1 [Anaeramoeba flamelloides]
MKFFIYFLLLIPFTFCGSTYQGSVFYSEGKYKFVEGIDQTATSFGSYQDVIMELGTDKLQIQTTSGESNTIQMHAAGYLEGYLTQKHIWNYHVNYKKGWLDDFETEDWPSELIDWMNLNIKFVDKQCEAPTTDLTKQFCLTREQYLGILEGYNAVAPDDEKIDAMELWLMQSAGDLDDLSIAVFLGSEDQQKRDMAIQKLHSDEWQDIHHHCSGLVRVLPDHSDIFFAQVTWSTYGSMNRMMKTYHFSLENDGTKANQVVFSSYPGTVFSVDDFYITDQNLCVLETTFNIFNDSLYEEFVTHNTDTFLTWMRFPSINRISDSGKEWTENMHVYNSGTYNNQYLVLDLKKFEPNNPELQDDLLWVLELIPGHYSIGDKTQEWLVDKKWYPSINAPENTTIFTISGQKQKDKDTPTGYWSYSNSSRMLIMERDVSKKIVDFQTFQDFMRFNDYENDQYSYGDPARSISSRYDLRTTLDGEYRKKPFGSQDAKCTSYKRALDLEFEVVVSPTYYNDMPYWEFGETPFENVSWLGLPKVWNFDWFTFKPNELLTCESNTDCYSCISSKGCGWCQGKCYDYDPDDNSQCTESAWYLTTCSHTLKDNLDNSSNLKLFFGLLSAVIVVIAILVVIFIRKAKKKKYNTLQEVNIESQSD